MVRYACQDEVMVTTATTRRRLPAAQNVIVVGAGLVGLSTALHLRHAGLEVTVVEADHAGAGASWGNAGWLTPEIATPLPEPSILKTGVKALVSANSPLYVPIRADLNLLRFLTGFLRHSTAKQWRKGMAALMPLNNLTMESFDELESLGVTETTHPTEFIAAFAEAGQESGLLQEFEDIRAAGYDVDATPLTGDEVREYAPALSHGVASGVRLGGTRFINPPKYVAALETACKEAGVKFRTGRVTQVDGGTPQRPAHVTLTEGTGTSAETVPSDVVVVATGAELPKLLRPFGVKMVVQAGRGYSFTVPVDPMPNVPLYFPHERVACTPLGDRYRVAGMMEFRRHLEPLDPRRIQAIVNATTPLLAGADFTDRVDEWVGSRPCTPDGLPLVGPTRSPRVVAAGGHGMWGVTQGPLTGKLITEYVTTGDVPAMLRPLDPLR